jgi:hypothetical protein
VCVTSTHAHTHTHKTNAKTEKKAKKATKKTRGEKKPLSGYMLFCNHHREAAKKQLPTGLESYTPCAVMTAIAKILSGWWALISNSLKAEWRAGNVPKQQDAVTGPAFAMQAPPQAPLAFVQAPPHLTHSKSASFMQ